MAKKNALITINSRISFTACATQLSTDKIKLVFNRGPKIIATWDDLIWKKRSCRYREKLNDV